MSNHPVSEKPKYQSSEYSEKIDSIIGIGRVTDIILDQSHPQYTSPQDIGKIFYQLLYKTRKTKNITFNPQAHPLQSNVKIYPILGEHVFLILGPSRQLNDNDLATQVYYFHPFNIWNEVHHNSFPDKFDWDNQVNKTPPSSEINPQGPTAEYGAFNYGGEQPFNEQTNINPLQPFSGDVIFEGRWGQSIRFGQTILIDKEKFSTKGFWPGSGKKNGSPITIITNNRGKNNSYSPSLENIDNDGTSIYLTSDQNISINDINVSRYPNKSYTSNLPSTTFNENQAIISSDRILFHSRKDFVMIFAKKGIRLSTKENTNIDSDKMISLNGGEGIELGAQAKIKGQPVVLSQNLIDIITPLVKSLTLFSEAVGAMSTSPESAIPAMVSSGKKLQDDCNLFLSRVKEIKSNNTFTI